MTLRLLLALAAASLLSACGSDPAPQPAGLAVTTDKLSVVANGNSIVRVTFSGDIQYPLAITTTRGYWNVPGKPQVTSLYSIDQADLVACDCKVDPACAGLAVVFASDAKQSSGRGNITFLTY